MLTVLEGLLVAAITGITYLAYRNEAAYRRLLPLIIGMPIGVALTQYGYSSGWEAGFSDGADYIGDVTSWLQNDKTGIEPTPAIKPDAWLPFVLVLVACYLFVLPWLMDYIKGDDARIDEDDGAL